MLKVALTGGIGCGKTTVCELFAQHNIPVIDTDIIARKLVEPGQAALAEIVSRFGKQILNTDGTLNRQALSNQVFNDADKRLQLESILHPQITARIKLQLDTLSAPYVIIAIPLLIENNLQSEYDRTLVIDCEEQQQIQRTLERDSRSLQEIKSIVGTQVTRQERLEAADDIIDNHGSLDSLGIQVDQLHNKYLQQGNT